MDGTPVSAATGAQFIQALTAGTHTVKNITIRADNSQDTVTNTVKVYEVSISGPNRVKPGATCSWAGSASSGTSPYSYSWSVGGTYGSGQNFTYTNNFSSGNSFTVQLSVTDGSGTQVTVSQNVSVSSTAPICQF